MYVYVILFPSITAVATSFSSPSPIFITSSGTTVVSSMPNSSENSATIVISCSLAYVPVCGDVIPNFTNSGAISSIISNIASVLYFVAYVCITFVDW